MEVSDTGKGFTEEQGRRLFQPFFTTRKGGHGLGLSISRAIIQDHKGAIEASGAPGAGATFTIRLPAAHASAGTAGRRNVTADAPGREKATIVVIDDDEAARHSIGQMLGLRGWAVEVFSSAEAALAWPGLCDAMCIVTDVKMPGMDGEEFLAHVMAMPGGAAGGDDDRSRRHRHGRALSEDRRIRLCGKTL